MCAEFTLGPPLELDKLLAALPILRKIIQPDPGGRIFPRGHAPILLKNESGELELITAEFSLIPPWWNPEKAEKKTKNNRPVFATHNARLESIDEKPTFKESFQKRHCLVPIYEFFESSLWGNKFAGHRIKVTTGKILLAAGCYSTWLDKSTGEIIYSFTIITHLPTQQIFDSGHDRMPVFLEQKEALAWLNSAPQDSKALKKNLIEHNQNKVLKFEVSVDRALKEGWQKNAPSVEELEEVQRSLA